MTTLVDRARITRRAKWAFRGVNQTLFSPSGGPPSVGVAVQVGLTSAAGMIVCCLVFGVPGGLIGLFGTMIPAWEAGRPVYPRIRNVLLIATVMTGSMACGVLIAPLGPLVVPFVTVVILVTVVGYYGLLMTRGPGPMQLFYPAVIGTYVGLVPSVGWQSVAATAFAAVFTGALTLLPVLVDPERPERSAVEVALHSVNRFDALPERRALARSMQGTPGGQRGQRDDAEQTGVTGQVPRDGALDATGAAALRTARDDAWTAVNACWIVVQSARWLPLPRHHPNRWERELLGIHHHLARLMVETTQWRARLMPVDSTTPVLRGRPPFLFLIRHATRWYSIAWFSAVRIALAALVAGGLTQALGLSHPYWAVLTSAILLQRWDNRMATTTKALQRAAGTALGFGIVVVVAFAHLSPFWILVIIVVCLATFQLVMMRAYTWGVALITPMALLTVESTTKAPLESLLAERAIATGIGVVIALLVVWLTGLRFPARLVQAQLRRSLDATIAVLTEVQSGTSFTAAGIRVRVELLYELITQQSALERATRDDPALARWIPAENALSDIGYLALAACWVRHPERRVPIQRTLDILVSMRRAIPLGGWAVDDPSYRAEPLERALGTLRARR